MNPKIVSEAKFIEKGQSLIDALGDLLDNGGPLLYNNANRTYNPLGTNTTKQIANNHLGLHFDKSGFLPINAINNPKSNYEAVEKQNKLLRSIGIDTHRTILKNTYKDMPNEQVGKWQKFNKNKPDALDKSV